MNGRYFRLLHHHNNNNNKSLLLPQSSLLHIPRDHHSSIIFFFNPNHCKTYPSKSPIINKFLLLILDPQSNHRHHFHHLHHFPHQIPLLNSRHVEDDQDSSFSPSPKDPSLHSHLQYLQQQQQQQQTHPPYPSDHPPKKRSYLLPPPATPLSSSSVAATVEYATKMEETANHHHRPASRLAVRGGIGEIVEVQGGHIVRSTGRKDRHSKVCTAKGPRDRRVRLSAHTAIQFYDVQDRLGYDRPSKAVDWLIKNAKSAIDELAKLPAWNPNIPADPNPQEEQQPEQNQSEIGAETSTAEGNGGRILEELGENPNNRGGGGGGGFLPLGSEIADSIKSFFPMETNSSSSSAIQFQNYSPPDLISRRSSTTTTTSSTSFCQNNNNNNQDLRLSLQSFHQAQNQHHHHQQSEQLFSATTQLGFDGASFPEEHGRLQRMIAWNNNGCGGGGGGGGFIFNSPSPSPTPMPMPTLPPILFGQSQYLSQRGPLQSSNNNPSIRAWIDSSSSSSIMSDHHHHNHYLQPTIHHQSSIGGGIGFDSCGGGGGFSGFRIPARIQGEEEHDGVSDIKPSSASSGSRH